MNLWIGRRARQLSLFASQSTRLPNAFALLKENRLKIVRYLQRMPNAFFWASRARLESSFHQALLGLRGAKEAWGIDFSAPARMCAVTSWAAFSTGKCALYV